MKKYPQCRERVEKTLFQRDRIIRVMLLMNFLFAGCAGPPPPLASEYPPSEDSPPEQVVMRPDKVYYTLLITNQTRSSVIIRATDVRGTKDLLNGSNLPPGASYSTLLPDLPRSIKVRWNDNTVTFHSVPENGVVRLTDGNSGWQGANTYVVSG